MKIQGHRIVIWVVVLLIAAVIAWHLSAPRVPAVQNESPSSISALIDDQRIDPPHWTVKRSEPLRPSMTVASTSKEYLITLTNVSGAECQKMVEFMTNKTPDVQVRVNGAGHHCAATTNAVVVAKRLQGV